MKYTTGQNEDGHWFVEIHDMDNPARLLDKKVCGSEAEAEKLRQEAMDQGVAGFTDEMKKSVTEPKPVDPKKDRSPDRNPFDHDGDGNPGGSMPRPTRAEATATAPPLHGHPAQGGKSPPTPSAHKPAALKAK